MKCADILDLLANGDVTCMPASGIPGIEAHLSSCSECADQWQAAVGSVSLRCEVPPLPPTLRARAQQLQDRAGVQTPRGSSRRPLLLGSLFLLGATASLFSVLPARDDRAMT
jgi:hypothetical protein